MLLMILIIMWKELGVVKINPETSPSCLIFIETFYLKVWLDLPLHLWTVMILSISILLDLVEPLVLGRYFPDCKVDIIRSSEEYGIGTTEVVEKVIDLIRNSDY